MKIKKSTEVMEKNQTEVVKIGDYQLEVNEQFIKSFSSMKGDLDCWKLTFDEITDHLIYFGSMENGMEVDYKNLIILMGSIRDIRDQLDELAAAKVTVRGREVTVQE